MARISKRTVDAAAPRGGRFYVWDEEIKGFGLLVLPSGVKSYIYQYRTPEGRTRRITIGKHGGTTAEGARKKALTLRRTVEDGGDPLAEKHAKREALTVGELLDRYLESAKFDAKAESTQEIDRGRIERHLRPTLGKRFVGKLAADDIRRAFGAIRDGKTAVDEKTGYRGRAIVTGGEGTARMAIRLLKAIMNWAVAEGLATKNPVFGVDIGTDGTRDAILDDAKAYERLFRTLDTMQDEKRIRPAVADAIRVIALTGARRGEIAGLCWRHVDLKAGTITLPPKAHKTGRKTGTPRVIGLPAAAQAIIAKQSEGKPDEYVFPPTKGSGVLSLSKPWRLVRAEAKLPEGIGLHGLRHSLASHMAMNGAQAAEIMVALGHRELATAQRYVHWAQDARATLAERAAAHVVAALEPKKRKPADIEALPAKRKTSAKRAG